ncbi:MAG: hypothetical protein M3125_05705 [Gemmatimonadota bacterium]|nr:hypothetical protein [Gemmatimonadota bacterium]
MIVAALLLAMQVVSPPAPAQGTAATQRLQSGITVQPDTVTVGSHFVVSVRVRAPEGSTIEWPTAPDTSETIEIVSSRAVDSTADSLATEETARWRLAAWDTGAVTMVFEDAIVTTPDGARRVPLGASVYVRSVLPADTSLHVPKPTRDILAADPPWWRWVVLGLLVLALLALLVWWWLRRRRRRPGPPPVDAMQYAEREFARVERLGLLEAGERGRFVALMVEVVRDYLALRVPGAASSLTSTELVRYLRTRRTMPVQRLATLLSEADLIKFARRPVTVERARELGQEARAIVREVEQVVKREQAASQSEKAA